MLRNSVKTIPPSRASQDSESPDLRSSLANECVRLRVTGEDLRARARRFRAYSGELLGRLHAADEFFAEALGHVGSLLAAPGGPRGEVDPLVSAEVRRIAMEVRELAQRLVIRGRELSDRASQTDLRTRGCRAWASSSPFADR